MVRPISDEKKRIIEQLNELRGKFGAQLEILKNEIDKLDNRLTEIADGPKEQIDLEEVDILNSLIIFLRTLHDEINTKFIEQTTLTLKKKIIFINAINKRIKNTIADIKKVETYINNIRETIEVLEKIFVTISDIAL